MRRPESDWLRQQAVLWAADGVDDFGATKVSSTGVQICVRLERGWRRPDDLTSDAQQVDAVAVVECPIAIGSIMWMGKLSDLPSPLTSVVGLMVVTDYNEVPDIKGRNVYRTVMLRKHHEKLIV